MILSVIRCWLISSWLVVCSWISSLLCLRLCRVRLMLFVLILMCCVIRLVMYSCVCWLMV